MFGTALANESSQGVKSSKALIASGRDAASHIFQIAKKLPDQICRQVFHSQAIDRFLEFATSVRQELCQHIAVASLGVD